MGTQGAKAFLLAEIQRDAIIARKEDLRAVRGFSEKELAVSMDLKRLFYKPAVMDVITELFWELHQHSLSQQPWPQFGLNHYQQSMFEQSHTTT